MTEDKIVEPFIEQYDDIRRFLSGRNNIVIGTMGPDSTSSVQATKYLCKNFGEVANYDLRLFPDFKQLLDAMNNDSSIDFALVPSAYERVTDFFWNINLENCLNFIFPTLKYGLVCKEDFELNQKSPLTVATCHAVENIIEELSDGYIKENDVKRLFTSSTTTALQEVLAGNADLAVTNETSFEVYKNRGIKFIFRKFNTKILWCLFKRKER